MLFKTLDPLTIKLYNTITGNAIYYENTSYSENCLNLNNGNNMKIDGFSILVCQKLNY